MKRTLVALCIAVLALPLFADDALVLPARVIRTYFVGAYASASKGYDSDGKSYSLSSATDSYDSIKAFNLGLAVEYGINDWISGAVQWVPGYFVASKVESDAFGNATPSLADAADLFMGAKVQIVGEKAPVQSNKVRFAFAPGIKVPLSKPDWSKEVENIAAQKDFLFNQADKHTFAIGGRGFFDYIVNEQIFLNLYSQFLFYPGSVKVADSGLYGNQVVSGYQAFYPNYDPSLKYGYDLTLEFEPHYSTMVSDGIEFEAGLPLTYTYSPAPTVSDDTHNAFDGKFPDSKFLTLGPNVTLFFQKAPLPIEVEMGDYIPLAGKNTPATNSFFLELKVYAKI